ncbi:MULTISPECIES: DUF3150 domain-containing protein [unclassified Pseudomonas]|uniref:DUF3150 domain-containing protein n=1 Tax=unclassified Pseudomonas TaxID=196821 RepID=UPI001F2EB93D|nr:MULTISPECIES: DUF3150 domain-containing protein [unclassified Pseudomonas]
MQNSNLVQETQILSKLLLVDLNVSIWSGRKKLRAEDLGVDLNLPPSELASLGSKRITDPDEIKEFDRLKRRAIRLLETNGVRFMGGYGLPNDVAPAVAAELQDIQRLFSQQIQIFIGKYDQICIDWMNKWNGKPQWRKAIENAITPKAVVQQRLGFRFTLCRVVPDASDASLSKGLEQEVQGLSGQLFREIADAAEDLLDNSFVGKGSVSRKAVSAMLKMHKKLSSLAFLNPKVQDVADYMMAVIGKLPKTGPYEGSQFQDLLGLIMNLSDETKILKMAEVFSKTSTDVQSTLQVQAPLVIDTSIAAPVVVESTEPHLIDDVETAFDLAGESLLANDVAVDGGHTAPSVTLDELMTGTTLEGDMSIGELSALAEQIQASAFQSVPVVETSALPAAHIVAPVVELQSGAIEFCM